MSKQRALIQDLDSLPYPAWDLFPLEEVYFPNSEVLYSEEGMLASRRLDINASYGCSLICRFCYHLGISGSFNCAGCSLHVIFQRTNNSQPENLVIYPAASRSQRPTQRRASI